MQIKKNAPAMPGDTASAHNTDPTTSRAGIVSPHQDGDKLALVKACRFSPKQARVIDALRPGGWVSRERIDREAGSSYGPDVIAKLRGKLGYEAIDCERQPAIDRDGKPCLPGAYRLTDAGRERLRQIEGRPAA